MLFRSLIMKLTASQLQKIIRQELQALQEKRVYDSEGNLVHPGGLPVPSKPGMGKKHQFSGAAQATADKYVAMLEEIKDEVTGEAYAKTPTFAPVADVIDQVKGGLDELILKIKKAAEGSEAAMAENPSYPFGKK